METISTPSSILRLRWEREQSVRQTAKAVGLSHGVISKVTSRAAGAGLDWAAVDQLEDGELERRLYGERTVSSKQRPEPTHDGCTENTSGRE